MDGVQARTPKLAHFNNGNVPFELLIKDNTIISVLGKHEPTILLKTEPYRTQLSEVLETSKRISKCY